jgi:putative ABC transport system permease protein
MMDELDELPPEKAAGLEEAIKRLEENRQGIILGKGRLAALNKRVGDRIIMYGINFRDIDLELDIVGQFPDGRYDNSAAINRDYLNASVEAYEKKTGKKHRLANKSLNLVWLRVADRAQFEKIAQQIMSSPEFGQPAVKVETATSGVAAFLEAYSDLIWGMRWLLAPAILATLSLVIANSISISVRERRKELAVFKVLGFRPWQIMLLVLGEALLVGLLAGLLSVGLTWWIVNHWLGGLKFPIAFFAAFFIPNMAIAWGAATGALTALAGSIVPAWNACRVKVTDVFARVT